MHIHLRRWKRTVATVVLAAAAAGLATAPSAGASTPPGQVAFLKARAQRVGVHGQWKATTGPVASYVAEIDAMDGTPLASATVVKPRASLLVPNPTPHGEYILRVVAVAPDGTKSAANWTYFTITLKPPRR
jgi:hypothetical protein